MADKTIINGDINDGTAKDQVESNNGTKVIELTRKIEALESEKLEMMKENQETKERIKKLTREIEELRGDEAKMKPRLREMEREIERADEDKKILETIATRAVELETEVSRLQHDLITAMNDGDEATAEVAELKRVLADNGVKVERLESEMENLKKGKAESEKKVKELERKIGILEVREMEERNKRVRVEEDMRDRIDEKEREISGFKKKVGDLESEVAKNGVDLDKLKFEKKGVEEALKESVDKVKIMELKMMHLQKEAEEAEKMIGGLKERTVEAVNGTAAEIVGTIDGGHKGLKSQWPVVAAGSTGTVVLAAAVLYVCYGRRK